MDTILVSYFVYFTMDRSFFGVVEITDVSTVEFTNKSGLYRKYWLGRTVSDQSACKL